MELNSNTRIGLIGFGFLLEFLSPCYTRFFDEKTIKTNIIAVTVDEKNYETKQRKYPFQIRLGGNLKMLKELKPHIILFAPPPNIAPQLIKDVLKPYYEFCKKEKIVFPDIYAFPPSPQGELYIKIIGEDIHVCNVLPNMMNEINGKSLEGKEGNTYLSFPDNYSWPIQNQACIREFFQFIGNVIEVRPCHVLDMLGTLATHETISFLVYDICDVFKQSNLCKEENKVAECLRYILEEKTGYRPIGTKELYNDYDSDTTQVLTYILESWIQGAERYLISVGMDKKTANIITVGTLDINLHGAQEQSRSYTEDKLSHHATRGGVAERGKLCYDLLVRKILKQQLTKLPFVKPEKNFYEWIENVIYQISKIVAIHGRRLADDSYGAIFSVEQHAILYTLFVRNIRDMAGGMANELIKKGTALYAQQRGNRMAQRTLSHGDKNDMLSYQIYGEWEAEQGTLVSEITEYEPVYTVSVHECPWYTVCKEYGYLNELKEYCRDIDRMLVKAYNPELELQVDGIRSLGDSSCIFKWNGLCMNEEAKSFLKMRLKEIKNTCKKDWEYHTQHVFSAMSSEISKIEGGEEINKKTLDDFEILFGSRMRKRVEEGKNIDFSAII